MPELDARYTSLDRLYRECLQISEQRKLLDRVADAQAAYLDAGGKLQQWFFRSTEPPLSAELDFVRVAAWRGASNIQIAATLWPSDCRDDASLSRAVARVREYKTRLRRIGALV